MWEFANSHPILFFFMVWIAAWATTRPFWYAWRAYKQALRARNIAAHGWPTAPIDADGDVVYPTNEE